MVVTNSVHQLYKQLPINFAFRFRFRFKGGGEGEGRLREERQLVNVLYFAVDF